ncbi:MAG: multicopper oxidase domain-containing protein, partial [Bacteroidota bacterium]
MKKPTNLSKLSFLIIFLLNLQVLQAQDSTTQFFNELLIPPVVTSPDYFLSVDSVLHNFNPSEPGDTLNTLIQAYAFNEVGNESNTILGPTIFWQFGSDINARVSNNLDQVTTVHWHGAHVPVAADGGPHQRIPAGMIWDVPEFTVMDRSATMWYHPHAMDLTYEHVQMGLSGLLIAEDPGNEDTILHRIHNLIPHLYGENDFPLIFQTKRFDRTDSGGLEIRRGFPGYKDKYVYLVNGRKDPIAEMPQTQVRVRVLNGDAKFAFNFGVGDRNFNSMGFQLIATDAGYTEQSYALDSILMGPGERTEWLIDLRDVPIGDTVFIYNKASSLPKSIIGGQETTDGFAKDKVLLAIVVTENTGPTYNLDFPIDLHPSEAPPLSAVSNTRLKVFRQDSFDGEFLYNIDSTLMDMMVVNDVVMMDSTEIWTIDNITNRAHPFHIHDIHFWVTQVIDAEGNMLNPDDYPTIFKGPKD